MSDPERRHVLLYEFGQDVLELRAAHREAHLVLARAWRDDGRLVSAGALGDPPHGSLFVFAAGAADAEAFATADPYVTAGVVARWRVEPWTVAVS